MEQKEGETSGGPGKSRKDYVARAEVSILAPASEVWDALVNPWIISRYMFNTKVTSDFIEGSPITWAGEWEGRPYEDKGIVLQVEAGRLIRYSHYSPASGLEDTPENYHTVSVTLSGDESPTRVTLVQDNNRTKEACEHSKKNWNVMLAALKRVVETDSVAKLFAGYEKAFAALDLEKSADYFSDTFISAGPRGAIARSKAEFLSMAGQAAEFYRRVGQTSARIISLGEIPVSDGYTLVKVHWGVTFRRIGVVPVEFDVSYLVQKTGLVPSIILFIAHEDEEEAMKKLGLLEGKPIL